MNLDVSSLTQMVFSIGVSWYLLVIFSKKLEDLAKGLQELSMLIRDTQKDSLTESKEVKDMFVELKGLIKETSQLVSTTSESVRIQNALTTSALQRLDGGKPGGLEQ